MQADRQIQGGGGQSSQTAESNRLAEEGFGGTCRSTMHALEHTVERQPLTAVLSAFGIGLGVGAFIGAMLAPAQHHRQRHIAETLGRRIMDSMEGWVPQTLKR